MGTEFADLSSLDEARIEAAKRIGQLLQERAGKLWADEDWQMDVTDEPRLILFCYERPRLKERGDPKLAN